MLVLVPWVGPKEFQGSKLLFSSWVAGLKPPAYKLIPQPQPKGMGLLFPKADVRVRKVDNVSIQVVGYRGRADFRYCFLVWLWNKAANSTGIWTVGAWTEGLEH